MSGAAGEGAAPKGESELRLPILLQGRYRLEAMLGSGGMGVVYRGTQLELDRPVAVKLIAADLSRNDHVLARFKREALSLAAIRHPHVVTVVDHGVDEEGRLFLVTELLEGLGLDEHLRRQGGRGLGVRETLPILIQLCAALGAIHEAGIIHRDLKPANIFLETVDGRLHVRLIDFGIARNAGLGPLGTGLVGSPAYMAPEQAAMDPEIDHRADLYSLGVVAYECLTGTRPLSSDSQLGMVFAQMNEAPVPLAEDSGPQALVALVMRLLEKEPTQRPGSAGELRGQLEEIEARLPTEAAIRVAGLPTLVPDPHEVETGPVNRLPADPESSVPKPVRVTMELPMLGSVAEEAPDPEAHEVPTEPSGIEALAAAPQPSAVGAATLASLADEFSPRRRNLIWGAGVGAAAVFAGVVMTFRWAESPGSPVPAPDQVEASPSAQAPVRLTPLPRAAETGRVVVEAEQEKGGRVEIEVRVGDRLLGAGRRVVAELAPGLHNLRVNIAGESRTMTREVEVRVGAVSDVQVIFPSAPARTSAPRPVSPQLAAPPRGAPRDCAPVPGPNGSIILPCD